MQAEAKKAGVQPRELDIRITMCVLSPGSQEGTQSPPCTPCPPSVTKPRKEVMKSWDGRDPRPVSTLTPV